MDSWHQSLVQQTIDRTTGVLPTVDDYIVSRRDNSGCKLFFSLIKCEDNFIDRISGFSLTVMLQTHTSLIYLMK